MKDYFIYARNMTKIKCGFRGVYHSFWFLSSGAIWGEESSISVHSETQECIRAGRRQKGTSVCVFESESV